MIDIAVYLFECIVEMSIPIAIVFEIGNLLVGTFMRVAFGGRLWFGK